MCAVKGRRACFRQLAAITSMKFAIPTKITDHRPRAYLFYGNTTPKQPTVPPP